MRRLALLACFAACVPNAVVRTAGDRLGVHGKHLHFVDHDTIDGSDIYTFCRNERGRDIGGFIPTAGRSYDGACITLVCTVGDNGRHCS